MKARILTPVLVCEDCGTEQTFRSYTYVRNAKHYAECIDLDLIEEGSSEEEAVGKLREAMFGYIETALSGDPRGLIPRRSPLSHRVRYFLHKIFDRKHSGHAPVSAGAVVETRFSHCS